jgi:hypothetical protein
VSLDVYKKRGYYKDFEAVQAISKMAFWPSAMSRSWIKLMAKEKNIA